ncbi:hypothetical protein [Cupriavidus malaysiensis]|uniref:hypothetical protein n=1 Tax=Cupriavidus malaysiensis TaxID=367825 RepID=UPI000A46AC7C|nr:hypothetical protein [Cupriavidus malaysiensis]
MDKFTLAVFSSAAVFGVMLLTLVYQFAGVQWKKRPWIPLCLGIALLLTMFLFHWWLETVASHDTKLLEVHARKLDDGAKGILMSLSIAYTRQAKFVELAVIPMAMALIGVALALRIENDFYTKLNEIDSNRKIALRLEAEIREAENDVVDALSSNRRGIQLLHLHEQVQSLKNDLLNQLETIRILQRNAGLRVEYGLGGH